MVKIDGAFIVDSTAHPKSAGEYSHWK